MVAFRWSQNPQGLPKHPLLLLTISYQVQFSPHLSSAFSKRIFQIIFPFSIASIVTLNLGTNRIRLNPKFVWEFLIMIIFSCWINPCLSMTGTKFFQLKFPLLLPSNSMTYCKLPLMPPSPFPNPKQKAKNRISPGLLPGSKSCLWSHKNRQSVKKRERLQHYKTCRNLYDKLVKLAKRIYYNKLLLDANKDSKKTWSILKDIISETNPNNSMLNKLNISQPDSFQLELKDPQLIAEFFNSFLPRLAKDIRTLSLLRTPLNVYRHMTIYISNRLLKQIIHSISRPLAHIFNQSLLLGIFPDFYKLVKVIPIFKSGDKCDPNNYRPTSLLSAFSKILEKIVYNRMLNFIYKCNLIYPRSNLDF